jgi:hypothetical protein
MPGLALGFGLFLCPHCFERLIRIHAVCSLQSSGATEPYEHDSFEHPHAIDP